MKKLYNNRFIFIVSISLVFVMVLTFGSVMLTKKNQTGFRDAGYIISSNKVLSFDKETTYRMNLNEKIVFTSLNDGIQEVSQDSFVHYDDKAISTLKNGAFVDLNRIYDEVVPYYNISNKSIIRYKNGGYEIKNGNETLYF